MKIMKGIVCYYSSTGNTRLACEYLVRHIKGPVFEMFDITRGGNIDLEGYDVVGFATSTDFFDPPIIVKSFVDGLPQFAGKPAFVFNTYGAISGRTLATLGKWVGSKGFKVIAGHSLHTPENYPPLVAKGFKHERAPNKRGLSNFSDFIAGLNDLLMSGENFEDAKIKIGIFNSLMPVFPRTKAKNEMGEKHVDEALCDECGICAKNCPYRSIELDPKPVFDLGKCCGCWNCFNHCPKKAIYTKTLRGRGHYPRPAKIFQEKMELLK